MTCRVWSCVAGDDVLRLVGSLKLQVSFAKEPYERDDILQKIMCGWEWCVVCDNVRIHQQAKSKWATNLWLFLAPTWISLSTFTVTPLWVMSHIWKSHVTHMNEACHTYAWVMSQYEYIHPLSSFNSHMWMSHVTHRSKSCHACECVMSHVSMWHMWKIHFTHMDESMSTREWILWHIWMSHFTRVNVTHTNM